MNGFHKTVRKISAVLIFALLFTSVVPLTSAAAVQNAPAAAREEAAQEYYRIEVGEDGKLTATAINDEKSESVNGYLLIKQEQQEQEQCKYSVVAPSDALSDENENITLYEFKDGTGEVYSGTGVISIEYNGEIAGSYYIYSGKICPSKGCVDVEGQLYSVDEYGVATLFTGVYKSKYYNEGKLYTGSSEYVKYGNYLYTVSKSGAATLFTGVHEGKYYSSGKLYKAKKNYVYKVYNKYLYRISTKGTAAVYKKNSKKSGSYIYKDKIYYSVSYKTGYAKAFTGVYNKRYYNAGKLGTAKTSYYRVYGSKLYKVTSKGRASLFIRSRRKSGTYGLVIKGTCYSISYKSGKAAKFTGVYKGKYYKSGKLDTAKGTYYRTYRKYLYKVTKSGKAARFTGVYNGKYYKSGKLGKAGRTYYRSYNKYLYRVAKSGKAAKFTGVYNKRYYNAGKLGTAKTTYYRVYSGRLYKVAKTGKASVYIKNRKKNGTYQKQIGSTYYKVSYKKGTAVKFTGFYNGRYYSNGKASSKSGWITFKGDTYYLKMGKRVTGKNKIGKKVYYFTSSGVLVRNQAMSRKAQKYSSATKWLILVNRSQKKVAVFYGSRYKWTMKKYFSCCVGAPRTPTIKGTFSVGKKGLFFYPSGGGTTCWYWTQFKGDYLFHSQLYSRNSKTRIVDGSMGVAVSHGCVRLQIKNAKWIYDHIPRKTKVVVY